MRTSRVWRYTPSRTDPVLREAIFVQRQELLNDLEEKVRSGIRSKNKHRVLLVGPRGIGKTHLISMLQHRVSGLDKLRIAWFSEDETIGSYLQFLKRLSEILARSYPAEFPIAEIESLTGMTFDQIRRILEDRLIERFQKQSLLILVENFDLFLNGLGDDGQKSFRAFQQEHPFTTIIATSQRITEDTSDRDQPLFGFFETIHLEPLSVEQSIELLEKMATKQVEEIDERIQQETKKKAKKELEVERKKVQELIDFLKTKIGQSRIETIHKLAGGNHRIYVILSEFLTKESLDDLIEPFEALADELTPYYQERLRWLSPQQRQIIELLCKNNDPLTPKAISEELLVIETGVGSQLGKLASLGYVHKAQDGRKSQYELAEPLMRLVVDAKEVKLSIRFIAEILATWFSNSVVKLININCKPQHILYLEKAMGITTKDVELSEIYVKIKMHDFTIAYNLIYKYATKKDFPENSDKEVHRDVVGLIAVFYFEYLQSKLDKKINYFKILNFENCNFILKTTRAIVSIIEKVESFDQFRQSMIDLIRDPSIFVQVFNINHPKRVC